MCGSGCLLVIPFSQMLSETSVPPLMPNSSGRLGNTWDQAMGNPDQCGRVDQWGASVDSVCSSTKRTYSAAQGELSNYKNLLSEPEENATNRPRGRAHVCEPHGSPDS